MVAAASRGSQPIYTYAARVAQENNVSTRNDRPIPRYLNMAKCTATTRAAATTTNGMLERVYIKDWRKEPVGVVKQSLRKAIGEWTCQESMIDEHSDQTTAESDIDAVRHLNQFGTPDTPLMEIACTPI